MGEGEFVPGQLSGTPAEPWSPGWTLPAQAALWKRGSPGLVLERIADTVKSASASASGDNAIWTPAAGKRFRLLGVMLTLTADATLAVAGRVALTFRDGTAPLSLVLHVSLGTLAVSGLLGSQQLTPWLPLGNGILSAAADRALNLNLSVALLTGTIEVVCAGTEE